MGRERVVITGAGAVSPYGAGTSALEEGLFSGKSAISDWAEAGTTAGVQCHVVGKITGVDGRSLSRELRRSMSSMSVYACLAAEEALGGLGPEERCATGIAIGSTLGSPEALHGFFTEFLRENDTSGIRSMVFFKAMGHTVASNVALACGCGGRLLAPAAACASGLQAMGLGYEAIAAGRETRMLCGGADELHMLTVAAFDRIGAASHSNNARTASRPFDAARDGIVCSEGAGLLLLENLETARARHALILGEVTGFCTNTAVSGLAYPDSRSVFMCMKAALDDAQLLPAQIVCVNAHATGTEAGDRVEGQAIAGLFGSTTPVNSLKGQLGHTLAASGPLETIACLHMWRRRVCLPTANLDAPDPLCGLLGHVRTSIPLTPGPVLKNSFGLGGCNASLIIQPYQEH